MSSNNHKPQRTTGNTIIEVLIATAVVGVILTALAYSLSMSVKNSAQAEYRQIATRYAQDAIETLRQQRSTLGWTEFSNKMPGATTSSCFPTSIPPFPSTWGAANNPPRNCAITHASPPVTMYRALQIDEKLTDSIKITVEVGWDDGVQYRSTKIQQEFKNF